MIYIYDILLNFCDNNLLYDFYEWKSDDNIENIKRIKLIHVTKDTFDDLLNYEVKIDKDFLLKIFKTCEVYNGKKIKIIEYCILISDGERTLAVEFNKDGTSIYKSKLLIEEEDEISILAGNLEYTELKYKKIRKVLTERFHTRNELVIKNYLSKEIENTYKIKNYNKLKYIYQEYFDKELISYKIMKDELINSMKDEINNKHINLYNLLKLTNKKKQV